jgi:SPP1 gp7 family putative phage head morphogenesis protein
LRYIIGVRKAQKELNEIIETSLDTLLDSVYALRQDAMVDDVIETTFDSLEEKFIEYVSRGLFEQAVTVVAADVLFFNDKKYERGIYGRMGFNNLPFDVQRSMVNSWVKENVRLIRNVNTTQMADLETAIMRATRSGINRTELGKEISKIMDTSVKRGSRIAADQTYKLDAQLDRAKQTSNGITHYIWRTMGDNRVRPRHQAWDGTRRSWKNDSPHPGQEINCRCIAEPDIEEAFRK